MFSMNNFYNLPTLMSAGDKHTEMVRIAIDRFQRAQMKGWLRRLFGALTGRCTCLVNLEDLRAEVKVANSRYVGVRTVSLQQICGSEGRSQDFDRCFNPLRCHTRQRWLNVMLAHMLNVPLPPVQLIQIGEAYFVRDGHHRISVAHALGEECIEAEVTVWEPAQTLLRNTSPVIGRVLAA